MARSAVAVSSPTELRSNELRLSHEFVPARLCAITVVAETERSEERAEVFAALAIRADEIVDQPLRQVRLEEIRRAQHLPSARLPNRLERHAHELRLTFRGGAQQRRGWIADFLERDWQWPCSSERASEVGHEVGWGPDHEIGRQWVVRQPYVVERLDDRCV